MLDVYIEAEYADGHIVREDERDVSAYEPGRNVFYDILNRLPEAEHGVMTRFSLVCRRWTYSIDWKELPENARPIRFKHVECDFEPGGQPVGDARMMRVDFGYQYTDAAGNNFQEVLQIPLA